MIHDNNSNCNHFIDINCYSKVIIRLILESGIVISIITVKVMLLLTTYIISGNNDTCNDNEYKDNDEVI